MSYFASRLGDPFFGKTKAVICLQIESCDLPLRGLSGTFVLERKELTCSSHLGSRPTKVLYPVLL